MKTMSAAIIEWVGPLCSSLTPKRMSASGISERTKISGMLGFTFRVLADGFPRRYASAMCPTANEAFFLLKSQTFDRRVIKAIGLEPSLGVRQSQPNAADRMTDDTSWRKFKG
jgi:hypothetical protein